MSKAVRYAKPVGALHSISLIYDILFHLISYKNPRFSCGISGFPFVTNFSGFFVLTYFTKYSIILLSIIIVLPKASPVRILQREE